MEMLELKHHNLNESIESPELNYRKISFLVTYESKVQRRSKKRSPEVPNEGPYSNIGYPKYHEDPRQPNSGLLSWKQDRNQGLILKSVEYF